ncbi:MAG: uroporphyrinogen-III C-methyltransferase [Eubacteriaceae bacterium]|nr:uroporphyrinogen-III C-methyltransferase [Eubacteriaceae bacterium]
MDVNASAEDRQEPQDDAPRLCREAFLDRIKAACSFPAGAEAVRAGDTIRLMGTFRDDKGKTVTDTLDGPAEEPELLGHVLASRMLSKESDATREGKVWLVGAGPGDEGLLTLKGAEVLSRADTVVYDALVGDGILALIPQKAERIFAGKRAGHHYLRQEDTNRVLVEKAAEGKNVVRLKGGDPFLFGRGGEELELLSLFGIPYEVVPGITSAFAVPAYNGIPVTHRDFCSSVHIITGHRRADHTYDIDFDALRRTKGTLVFLMGVASLPDICDGLLKAGMDPDTPAAVLERGTTARQHRICGTLATLAGICAETTVMTPAIIVVGKVVSLADRFAWAEARPLAGLRVVVTRHRDRDSSLAPMLREKGAEVIENPAIETRLLNEDALCEAADELALGVYSKLVFTSPICVRKFLPILFRDHDIRSLANVRIVSVGDLTAKELSLFGLRADWICSEEDGDGICRGNGRTLILRERTASPAAVKEGCGSIEVYETVNVSEGTPDIASQLRAGEIDLAVFTSVSTVKAFAACCPGEDLSRVRAVCIGEQTAEAARETGMNVRMSEKATLSSLEKELEKAWNELR